MAKKNGNTKWVLGGLVIAAAIGVASFQQLGDNLVYFYTPSEAVAKSVELAHQTIKVGGMVMAGSVKWEKETANLAFMVTDFQGNDIEVFHKGSPPDMFKEGQGVVVEGRIAADGKTMTARHLLVKHSEEYKTPEEGHMPNKALLEKSIFKNEAPAPAPENNESH